MIICKVCGQKYDNETIPFVCGLPEVMMPESAESLHRQLWHYEDELPEGYPYETAFCRSMVIDGVRMFPPMASVQDAKATTRKLAMNAENAIFEALALSGEPVSKDTETWLNAAAMLVRRAIESL